MQSSSLLSESSDGKSRITLSMETSSRTVDIGRLLFSFRGTGGLGSNIFFCCLLAFRRGRLRPDVGSSSASEVVTLLFAIASPRRVLASA